VISVLKLKRKPGIKVKLDKDACSLVLQSKYISKKDLGAFISNLILEQKNLDNSIENFISEKYSISQITDFLSSTKKKTLKFGDIRKHLRISKRKFYSRLKIIRNHIITNRKFNWAVKRGKFVRIKC
jgi:predicted double-glycine peptidase